MLVKKYIERKLIHIWVWRDWGNETRHANDSNNGKFESFYLESVSVKPTFYNYSDGLLSQWLTYKVVSIHSNPLINLKDINILEKGTLALENTWGVMDWSKMFLCVNFSVISFSSFFSKTLEIITKKKYHLRLFLQVGYVKVCPATRKLK